MFETNAVEFEKIALINNINSDFKAILTFFVNLKNRKRENEREKNG